MPCSYSRDIFGRHILVGLTYAETHEFELLDAAPPMDEHGQLLPWETDDKSSSVKNAAFRLERAEAFS